MHEEVWFRNNNFWQNDSCENLEIVQVLTAVILSKIIISIIFP